MTSPISSTPPLAAAEPTVDDIDRALVRSRALGRIFETDVQPLRIGRYVLGDRLGAGGMGVVYGARDPDLDREVAIKLVRVREREREATLREAKALARLNHPNIVAVHDVGIVGDNVYIVMEFVRGETLRSYSAKPDRTAREIASVYRQAALGLAAAHRAGLIHRDFKPENAVVGDDARLRLIDFGLAQEERSPVSTSRAGTPRYMAPEQQSGDELTTAVDQFALSASLKEALANLKTAAPPWLENIAARGTEVHPSDRFDDLAELAVALGRDPRAIKRRRVLAVLALAAIGVAFGVGNRVESRSLAGDSCNGGMQVIAESWDDRDGTLVQLKAFGDYGGRVAERLAGRADLFANNWATVHRQSCQASKRGELTSDLYEAQLRCLDRQKHALVSLIEIADNTKREGLSSLATSAEALPSPTACADLEGVSVLPAPPKDVQDTVVELARGAEEIRMRLAAGQFASASDLADGLATRARRTGYAPMTAELALLSGRTLMISERMADAIAPLTEATMVGLSAGSIDIAVEAWARRAWIEGVTQSAPAVPSGSDLVLALAEQLGDRSFAAALLYNNLGGVHHARGNRSAARDFFSRAVTIARRIEGRNTVELVNSRGNLARVTDDEEARAELSAEAIAVLTNIVGPNHPHTLRAVIGAAYEMVDVKGGRALLKQACTRLQEHHPELRTLFASCVYELGWFAVLDGDHLAAATAMAMSVSVGTTNELAAAGMHALFRGEPDEARRLLAPLLTAPLADDAPWWQVRRRGEVELAYSLASARGTVPPKIAAALELLEKAGKNHPVVARRLAAAHHWRHGFPKPRHVANAAIR